MAESTASIISDPKIFPKSYINTILKFLKLRTEVWCKQWGTFLNCCSYREVQTDILLKGYNTEHLSVLDWEVSYQNGFILKPVLQFSFRILTPTMTDPISLL